MVEIMSKELKGEKKIYLLKTPKNQSGYFSKGLKLNSGQNSVCHHAKILVNTLKEFSVNFFPAI